MQEDTAMKNNARNNKALRINKTNNGYSIDNLSDDVLLEILCRLPRYSDALRFKTVSKRWCALISHPSFVAQGFSTHVEVDEDNEQPWTSLLLHKTHKIRLVTAIVVQPDCESVFWSPTLSIDFLPSPFRVRSTFKDLVLCSNPNCSPAEGQFYLINLLTKQWITLPPSPTHKTPFFWAGLVGRKGGCFRVVVLDTVSDHFSEDPFINYKWLIYLSETGEWKRIEHTFKIQIDNNLDCYPAFTDFFVCKSMVCFSWRTYFGAFNPFEATSTFTGSTLTLMSLPFPPTGGKVLLESCRKLIAINPTLQLRSHEDNTFTLANRFVIWKLDRNPELINEQTLTWKLVSNLDVFGSIVVQQPLIGELVGPGRVHSLKVLDIHPGKEHLVYLKIEGQDKLLVCNTREKHLKILTQREVPACDFLPYSLLQAWPTPISFPGVLPKSNESIGFFSHGHPS